MSEVVVVTAASEVASGGGNHLFNLVRGIHIRGRDIAVVCLQPGTLYDCFRCEGIPVYLNLVREKFDLAGVIRLRTLFQVERPTIVHTHGERGMFIANWVARSLGIPAIITTVHRSIARTMSWNWVERTAYEFIEDVILRYATTVVIAVSESMRTELVENRKHDPNKIAVIHNGVQILVEKIVTEFRHKAATLRLELSLDENTYVVGSVGRLTREKGYTYLIEAIPAVLDRVPQTCFVLVGDGPEREPLEELSRSCGVANYIRFVGHQMDVNKWLAMFDLFVLPSVWDSFGLAVAEAMVFSIPVVAFDSAGPSEIIAHQYSGLLVPVGDVVALSQAVIDVYQDPQLAERIGQHGRAVVSQQFSVDQMIEKTLALYDVQLAGQGSA